VTESDVIAHWRKGARDELESARLLHAGRQYAGSLFHSHLAVEKALKAAYMEQCGDEAPYTHNLLDLATLLGRPWTDAQKAALDRLTDFVVAARYSDPAWAGQYATAEHAAQGITDARTFLSLPGL